MSPSARVWFILFTATSLREIEAQKTQKQAAVVFYDHRGGNNPRVHTMVDGKQTLGGLNEIKIPTGQAACFVVERANTLLYGYSLNAEALKGQTLNDATEVVTALAKAISNIDPKVSATKQVTDALLASATTPQAIKTSLQDQINRSVDWFSEVGRLGQSAKLFNALQPATGTEAYVGVLRAAATADSIANSSPPPEVQYASDTKTLGALIAGLDSLRKVSATDTSLVRTVRSSEKLLKRVLELAQKMNSYAEGVQSAPLDVLRQTQKALVAQAQNLVNQYTVAQRDDRREFCHTVQDARVRLNLIVAAKPPAGGVSKADTVASFIVEPENEKSFEVVPAFVASFRVSGVRAFEVEGGLIKDVDPGIKFAPAAFSMWRIADRKPFWAAVGAAPGRGDFPDAHFGLVLRLGEERLSTNLVLGAGLTFAHAPVSLSGASVGGALPDGKTLKDVTTFGYRAGPTVFLTISGLSLGLGKIGIAASPDAK